MFVLLPIRQSQESSESSHHEYLDCSSDYRNILPVGVATIDVMAADHRFHRWHVE
jgi:hypothetical protein